MSNRRTEALEGQGGLIAVLGALAGRSCGVGAVFLLTLLVGRTLGATESGYFFLFQAWSNFLAVVVAMGLPMFVLRSVVASDQEGRPEQSMRIVRRSVTAVLVATTVLVIGLYVGRVPIMNAFAPIGAPYSLPWLAAGTAGLLTVVRLYAEAIKARFYANRSLLIQFALVPSVAALIFVCFLFLATPPGSTVAMFAYVLAGLVGVFAGALGWRSATGRSPGGAPSTPRPHQRGSLLLLWLVTVFEVGYEVLPYLLLGQIVQAEDVGRFGAAMRVAAIGGVGLTAVSAIYGPAFARAFQRYDRLAMANSLRSSQLASVGSYLPWLVPIFVFPEPLMGMFGPDFRGGAHLLVLLACGQLVNAATGVVNIFLQVARHEALSLAISAGSMVLMLVGGIICGRIWGVTGVAAQYAAILAARNILLWIAVRRVIAHQPDHSLASSC